MTGRVKTLVLTLTLLSLFGCGTNPYRTFTKNVCDYDDEKKDKCADYAIQHHVNHNQSEFHLAFVEYDDQGQLYKREQLKALLDKYYPLAKNNDVLLILYIHGWHHDADGHNWHFSPEDDPDDEDIQKFRGLLNDITQTADKFIPKKVLGVYVGWRGESIPVEGLNLLTFYDRKTTSHIIAQQGITEALLKIEDIIDQSKKNKKNSFLVTIGHSFGGQALYTSLQQLFVDRLIESRKKDSPYKAPDSSYKYYRGFGDLVVLLNPAFESARYSTLYDISQEGCQPYETPALIPRLVTLTSENDYATGFFFPLGRFFSQTFFYSHNILKDRNDCKGDDPIPVESKIDEFYSDLKTIGHFQPYITHCLTLTENPNLNCDNLQAHGVSMNHKQQYVNGKVELTNLGKTHSRNPYLNVLVDKKLIDGHNDIWQPGIRQFIIELIKNTYQRSYDKTYKPSTLWQQKNKE